MSNAMSIVKILGAWGCIIAAITLLILGQQASALPGVLGILSIGFSLAPTGA